jgi:hypothetical protein
LCGSQLLFIELCACGFVIMLGPNYVLVTIKIHIELTKWRWFFQNVKNENTIDQMWDVHLQFKINTPSRVDDSTIYVFYIIRKLKFVFLKSSHAL